MNIAILGYGIVGGGVHALLRENNYGIHVKRVLDVRPLEGLDGILTDNIADVIGDPDIDCVVETIGGMHPALSFVTASLRAGKHVVTSNKELISNALAPLVQGAALHRVQMRYSASVGGGIPWLENLGRQKRGDTIEMVHGIVNGTTNYILDAMAHGATFEAALDEARKLGYAEVDASADLDGIDAQRKCAISAAVAFDTVVEPKHVPALGIGSIRKGDVDAFSAKGLICKLMMRAERLDGSIAAYVEPTLLTDDSPAAHVPTNHNWISMRARHLGNLAFFGQGAGRYPTAENVVQDLIDIAAGIPYHTHGMHALPVQNEAVSHPYYIRTSATELTAELRAQAFGPGILTHPVDVAKLHAVARDIRAADPDAFIAGVPKL